MACRTLSFLIIFRFEVKKNASPEGEASSEVKLFELAQLM